jgi:hypothetical protein
VGGSCERLKTNSQNGPASTNAKQDVPQYVVRQRPVVAFTAVPNTTTTETLTAVTTRVTTVAWERGSSEWTLVAWVRTSRDDVSAALRIQILRDFTVRSLHTGLGGPAFQIAALAAVEQYVADHRREVERLLAQPPG